jgi:predicted DNA-binding ribbon-helix-helix protein
MAFMKSLIVKRSVFPAGHKTSVSLEDDFWEALKEIARARNLTLSSLVQEINAQRQSKNLSSAIRLFVLAFYRGKLSAELGNERLNGDPVPPPPALS